MSTENKGFLSNVFNTLSGQKGLSAAICTAGALVTTGAAALVAVSGAPLLAAIPLGLAAGFAANAKLFTKLHDAIQQKKAEEKKNEEPKKPTPIFSL